MLQDKLIMALIDSGSSVNLLSDTFYKQLGVPSKIRAWKKIVANNEKMAVNSSTAIQVQLPNFHLR